MYANLVNSNLMEKWNFTTVNYWRSPHRSSYKQMDVIIFHVSLFDARPSSHTLTISTIRNRKRKVKGQKSNPISFPKIMTNSM